MIKHINNVPPLGGKRFTLKYGRRKEWRRKTYCAAAYHTTCLGEVIETDVCTLAPSFQDSQEIDGCLPKPLKQL